MHVSVSAVMRADIDDRNGGDDINDNCHTATTITTTTTTTTTTMSTTTIITIVPLLDLSRRVSLLLLSCVSQCTIALYAYVHGLAAWLNLRAHAHIRSGPQIVFGLEAAKVLQLLLILDPRRCRLVLVPTCYCLKWREVVSGARVRADDSPAARSDQSTNVFSQTHGRRGRIFSVSLM